MRSALRVGLALAVLGMVVASTAWALPEKGAPVTNFRATDLHGNEVDLREEILRTRDSLAIVYFFTPDTGVEVARALDLLHEEFVKDKNLLRIIAIGLEADKAALQAFAEKHGIEYFVIPDDATVNAETTYGPFASLPVTFIVTVGSEAEQSLELLKAIGGGGKSEAEVINYIARHYLMREKPENAEAAASVAAKAGENPRTAQEIKAFAQVEQGKLDDAMSEFQQIDSKAGLAAVALEKGEYDKAVELAEQAPNDSLAQTIKGEALLRAGKAAEAAAVLDAAAASEGSDWQKHRALQNGARARQEQGKLDDAISGYQQALELNPWDVTALSNESAAYQEKGDLQNAEAALQRARNVANDDALVTLMLRQVQQQLENANNTQRRELIQKQIADLQKRFQELKAAGRDKPADEWTSRPLVLAFLPSENKDVFFERAGTDVAIQRELEARLQAGGRVQVVERELLDALLQELNLGASDMANPDTQLRLGQVLSAQLLGFSDFAQTGPDKKMYLRLVNTETTAIDTQLSRDLEETGDISAFVDALAEELTQALTAKRRLQGLIADVPSAEQVYINLGEAHGVRPGLRFTVLQDGPPIEAGGKTLGRRAVPVATLEVVEVDEQLSLCDVVDRKGDTPLAKEMKVKELAPQGD
jgi:tetratricopeptide (TPR) repeat protein